MITDALTIIYIVGFKCVLVLYTSFLTYPLVLLNTLWFVGSYYGLLAYTLAYTIIQYIYVYIHLLTNYAKNSGQGTRSCQMV